MLTRKYFSCCPTVKNSQRKFSIRRQILHIRNTSIMPSFKFLNFKTLWIDFSSEKPINGWPLQKSQGRFSHDKAYMSYKKHSLPKKEGIFLIP